MLRSTKHRLATSLLALVIYVPALTLTTGAQANSAPAQMPTPTPAGMKRPDPQMQAVLDKLAALGSKPIETLTPDEARRQPTPADAVKALLRERGMSDAPEPVGKVEDRMIRGADGQIVARIYTPSGRGPFPVVVYFHGGGWVIAIIDTYDSSARSLTNAAQSIVVSVEYRKGPENKFPAAHDDAFAAYRWTLENARALGGDPAKIAVAGESAGANLAANVSIMARERKVQMPLHQVLVYPVANNDLSSPSMIENANAKPLNRAMIEWFLRHYLKNQSESSDPRISLVRAELRGLPPTTIIAAEIDPLCSEGRLLAEHLQAAGVRVDYRNYDGVTHEFFGMGAVLDKARAAVGQAAKGLREAFGNK